METSISGLFERTESSTLLLYSKHDSAKPALKEALSKFIEFRGKVEQAQRGIADEQGALKEIADDQERIRKNIERVPKEADAFKRYLMKFDAQETEIEKRQSRLKELRADLSKHEKALKDYAETAKATAAGNFSIAVRLSFSDSPKPDSSSATRGLLAASAGAGAA